MWSSVQGAPQSPQMCRCGRCLLVRGPSNSQSGSNGSRNMAARAARPTQGMGVSGMGPPLDNNQDCRRWQPASVPWITSAEWPPSPGPARGRVDTSAAFHRRSGTHRWSRRGLAGWSAATSDGGSAEAADGQPEHCAPGATVSLANQVGLALVGQGSSDHGVLRLHDDPPLLWAPVPATVGIRPPGPPQVQTLDFGGEPTLSLQLTDPRV